MVPLSRPSLATEWERAGERAFATKKPLTLTLSRRERGTWIGVLQESNTNKEETVP
jgi:hypothetical protein